MEGGVGERVGDGGGGRDAVSVDQHEEEGDGECGRENEEKVEAELDYCRLGFHRENMNFMHAEKGNE